jgi:polar amino acid transport system substrate-binding protein
MTVLRIFIALAMTFAATVGASAEDALQRVKAAGVLKIGTVTDFAPFDFIDAGKHAGLNVDLFDQVGKELGVKVEWILLPWDGVLPGLESGKFDLAGGPVTVTKARMERYRFTAPVADATDALLKRTGDTSITKPADIAGKTVGSSKASAQMTQLIEFAKTLPAPVTTKEYPGFNEAYADLAAGRTSAVANAYPNVAYTAKTRGDVFSLVEPTFGTKTYFAHPGRKEPEYASLMDAIDAAILKIKADGRMAALQKKWFGVSFDTPDHVKDPPF